MPAEIIELHPQNPQENRLKRVVECLRDGGIIIYPTDTVYGMGCQLHDARAIERLCKIQQVNARKLNLSFICQDLSQVSDYVKQLPSPIFKLMKKTLPGPYTFLLEASNKVPKILDVRKHTVGIRIPNHPIPMQLVDRLEAPLISSSLKTEDPVFPYFVEPEEMMDRYKHLVDIIIDGGPGGILPSTVLDCLSGMPEVQREGLGSIDVL
ncbi:MAG: L-threonylcarbamoyladenylate synthase [Cytophagaceae bacterium]|jgi:tRNA threonylcarbamoyl adenosine modification protein (Sua5/YciO/YrdC/YwlC family)|nr:L-threonylcarbamoyladenylate synthase [Cytophagaceae bacterium]